MTISREQIAHDLAVVYVTNRFGAEVTGYLSVDTYDGEVTGSGTVETKRLPDTDKVRTTRVPTGEKTFLGLIDRTEAVESGHEVDGTFREMISDYWKAFSRFCELLEVQ